MQARQGEAIRNMEGAATADLSHSPTPSMAATQAGIILGTAAYMSPEQAKGFQADARSDVFSFGCVLYEMLAGRQAFQGDTAAETMASVLVREADFNVLPANLNPRLRDLLRRCLEKNPKRRWHAVADLRMELETVTSDAYGAVTTTEPRVAPVSRSARVAWPFSAGLALGVVAIVVLWSPWRTTPKTPAAPIRLTTELGADVSLATVGNPGANPVGNSTLAFSPDGSVLA